MKFTVARNSIIITPENEQDESYIEDTLGLKNEYDWVKCVRVAPYDLPHSIAYLEIRNREDAEGIKEETKPNA